MARAPKANKSTECSNRKSGTEKTREDRGDETGGQTGDQRGDEMLSADRKNLIIFDIS